MSDEVPQEPKKVCVLDKLPKSTLSLDSLKRDYNDHKKTDQKLFSLESFTSGFDSQGYSLWRTEYKFNDELDGRPDFVLKNTVNGMIQGLDYARKYAFGKLLLVKNAEGQKRIVGLWIIRGSEPLPEVFDDMCVSHTWSPIEFNASNMELYDVGFYGETFENSEVIYGTQLL